MNELFHHKPPVLSWTCSHNHWELMCLLIRSLEAWNDWINVHLDWNTNCRSNKWRFLFSGPHRMISEALLHDLSTDALGCTDVQRQTAVTAYFTGKQLLLFAYRSPGDWLNLYETWGGGAWQINTWNAEKWSWTFDLFLCTFSVTSNAF